MKLNVTLANDGNCETKTCPIEVNIKDKCGFW